MFFTMIARGMVWLVAIKATINIVIGFSVAFGSMSPEAIIRYTSSTSSGEVIDKGFFYLSMAIVVGVLTDISKSVRTHQSES